jgi:hypothetical protein
MIIKAKYFTAIMLIILFTSGLVYQITDKTNNFGLILLGMTIGSFFGIISYCSAIYYGTKIASKFFKY